MLERFVKRAVLRAIEKLDQPRENVNFLDLCNTSTKLFGKSGSEHWRLIREFWGNIKQRHIRSYAELLTSEGIAHSEATKSLLQELKRVPSPDTNSSCRNSASSDQIDDITNQFHDNLNLSSQPQKVAPAQMPSSCFVPTSPYASPKLIPNHRPTPESASPFPFNSLPSQCPTPDTSTITKVLHNATFNSSNEFGIFLP